MPVSWMDCCRVSDRPLSPGTGRHPRPRTRDSDIPTPDWQDVPHRWRSSSPLCRNSAAYSIRCCWQVYFTSSLSSSTRLWTATAHSAPGDQATTGGARSQPVSFAQLRERLQPQRDALFPAKGACVAIYYDVATTADFTDWLSILLTAFLTSCCGCRKRSAHAAGHRTRLYQPHLKRYWLSSTHMASSPTATTPN